MALTTKTIELPNLSNAEFNVDTSKVDTCKDSIKNDIAYIVEDIEKIKEAYKAMADHKKTKGTYKDLANACVKKVGTYTSNLSTTKTTLQDSLTDSLLAYIMAFIQNAQKVTEAANNINTKSE
jgi:hypothetical protein